VNGVVDRVYVSLGDYVNKGQNLFELRSSELSALQAELVASLSEKKIAERQWKTAQLMSQDEMLSEKELFEAEARLQQATAVLKRLEADLSLYGYNAESGTFSVKAPMDGYVVYKSLSSGSTVAAGGEVLFTIADLSSVWVTVNVYAGNLTAVKEGMEAEIQLLSYPNQLFYGNINQLSQVFDPEENVLKARIYVSNKDLKFKPEMSVVVKLTAVSDSLEIAVPTSALVFDDNRYFVIVQRDRDGFEVREVTPDGQVDEMTYIQSGLSGGESVVTENQLLIYSQLK
jgi:cobalt-zinc-cadmium efflux system membrane fusion protein